MRQAVDRLTRILAAIGSSRSGMTLAEVSVSVELPKSTVYRILQSLVEYGLVHYDDDRRRYRLGLGIVTLASSALSQQDVREIARPHLEKLLSVLDTTVFLSVLENDQVICIEKLEPVGKSVRFYVQLGAVMPYHASAAAKAILAFQPALTIERILQQVRFQPYTDFTITSPRELEKELARVREQGYSVCDREMERLVWSVGAPVFESSGRCRASVAAVGLVDESKGDYIASAARPVMDCARNVSRQLMASQLSSVQT